MALSAAERQRRCREKRNLNPESVAEVKRKDLERYHARKKLVKDMTPKEHKKIKRQWQIRNKKRRERQKALQNVLINTPASTPTPSSPRLHPFSPRSRSLTPASSTASARGRKQVRRDRSRLYRNNIELQDQVQELLRKVHKYKKRLQRKKKKENNITHSGKENEKENRKYAILSNTIQKHYKDTKDHKTSHDQLMDKIHPLLINNRTHILVKVVSERKKIEYTYLGVAQSEVDKDGDVRIMFYKCVDDTGKLFKLVESDVSDVEFENLLQIIPPPKVVKKGKRVFYEYDQAIDVFKK